MTKRRDPPGSRFAASLPFSAEGLFQGATPQISLSGKPVFLSGKALAAGSSALIFDDPSDSVKAIVDHQAIIVALLAPKAFALTSS